MTTIASITLLIAEGETPGVKAEAYQVFCIMSFQLKNSQFFQENSFIQCWEDEYQS